MIRLALAIRYFTWNFQFQHEFSLPQVWQSPFRSRLLFQLANETALYSITLMHFSWVIQFLLMHFSELNCTFTFYSSQFAVIIFWIFFSAALINILHIFSALNHQQVLWHSRAVFPVPFFEMQSKFWRDVLRQKCRHSSMRIFMIITHLLRSTTRFHHLLIIIITYFSFLTWFYFYYRHRRGFFPNHEKLEKYFLCDFTIRLI